MFRRICSLIAALAFLSPVIAGAVPARSGPFAPAPSGVVAELWQWAASHLAPIFQKEGSDMDPNGYKRQPVRHEDAGHRTAALPSWGEKL